MIRVVEKYNEMINKIGEEGNLNLRNISYKGKSINTRIDIIGDKSNPPEELADKFRENKLADEINEIHGDDPDDTEKIMEVSEGIRVILFNGKNPYSSKLWDHVKKLKMHNEDRVIIVLSRAEHIKEEDRQEVLNYLHESIYREYNIDYRTIFMNSLRGEEHESDQILKIVEDMMDTEDSAKSTDGVIDEINIGIEKIERYLESKGIDQEDYGFKDEMRRELDEFRAYEEEMIQSFIQRREITVLELRDKVSEIEKSRAFVKKLREGGSFDTWFTSIWKEFLKRDGDISKEFTNCLEDDLNLLEDKTIKKHIEANRMSKKDAYNKKKNAKCSIDRAPQTVDVTTKTECDKLIDDYDNRISTTFKQEQIMKWFLFFLPAIMIFTMFIGAKIMMSIGENEDQGAKSDTRVMLEETSDAVEFFQELLEKILKKKVTKTVFQILKGVSIIKRIVGVSILFIFLYINYKLCKHMARKRQMRVFVRISKKFIRDFNGMIDKMESSYGDILSKFLIKNADDEINRIKREYRILMEKTPKVIGGESISICIDEIKNMIKNI